MLVNREELLDALAKGGQGVTQYETLEQSNNYIFSDGKLITFDGDILAISKFDVGFTAAVPGTDFKKMLAKLPDKEIDMELKDNELVLKGRKKRSGITVNQDINLPYKEVPAPPQMKKVPEHLGNLLLQAARICNKDYTNPNTTHVHVGPNLIEATDTYRIFRAKTKTGLTDELLIPAQSILSIGNTVLKKAGYKDGWLYAKTVQGTFLAMRCGSSEYFRAELMDDILSVKGHKWKLPKDLPDILDRAQVMEDVGSGIGEPEVQITLTPGMAAIRTEKTEGWYEERRKVAYKGDPMKFVVNPNSLKEMLSRTDVALIGDKKMKISDGEIELALFLESM